MVLAYRSDLREGRLVYTEDELERELHGMSVACFCPTDEECHGDVILEVANRSTG